MIKIITGLTLISIVIFCVVTSEDNKGNKVIISKANVTNTEIKIENKDNKVIIPNTEIKHIKYSKYLNKSFGARAKTIGQDILNHCNTNDNVKKLMSIWEESKGEDYGFLACATAFYENYTFKTDTVGVCNKVHQINGDYRNCVFADINSHGMDVGLIQINTYFQSKNGNIKSLGGPDCVPKNSKSRNDPCNQILIDWLFNVENNAKISLKIVNTQGISAWSAYNKNIAPYL